MITTCSYIHCKTGLPGIVVPIAQFKAKNAPAYMPKGHAIIGDLRLCESCALTAKIDELVTDKRWAEICHQIKAAGGAEPDRDSLELLLGAKKDKPFSPALARAIKRMRSE